MSTALMHEFTHAPAIVGSDYLLDQPCVLGGRSVKAYGWQCIVQLATNTPDLAIKNADSFSFYVTAMFLSLSDWSLGYPRAIPADTSNPTDDGLAAMMSHLTV
ncbi:hypothetical protein N7471_011243 [Penicillium samsonianum]|uniref:uncharacterized protein n=1 Tax=Penicillium samsonianum TaxID=1882272 RepID=UPI002547CCB3|nr:uncharacterized protein N7471_011243 [Penicillium samsonianum]KAJ6123926.1 hypothetical protein N7471_011243 [Penicillium samsonianum]